MSATSERLAPVPRDAVQNLIDEAPASEKQVNTSVTNKLKSFCLSRLGLALISFILFFILFLVLQPKFIFKKSKDGLELPQINYMLIFICSLVGAALVYFLPLVIGKKKC
uniref:Uncharacterized protein n=1 Tax=viral metagenome TaxID=1070528 RepID=A0A6C0BN10_9ZZZZ